MGGRRPWDRGRGGRLRRDCRGSGREEVGRRGDLDERAEGCVWVEKEEDCEGQNRLQRWTKLSMIRRTRSDM